MTADGMGRCIFGCSGLPVLATEGATLHDHSMQYTVIRTPGGGYAVEAEYDLPARSPPVHDAEKEAGAALSAKASAMVEAGYGRNDDERAVLQAMFRTAKTLSLAREDSLGRSRDGLTN